MEFVSDDGGLRAVCLDWVESAAWDQVPWLRAKLIGWMYGRYLAQGWDTTEIAVYYDDGARGGTLRLEHTAPGHTDITVLRGTSR